MEILIQHFDKTLILALLLALFFKETLSEFINAKLGLKKSEKVPEWGSRLVQYANHDTTAKLDKLIAMEEKEHESNDFLRETLKDLATSLREFKEYGIKCRKE